MEEGDEFDYYRQLYIIALNSAQFPWKAAYYYYTIHIDRIDIMSFHEFRETIQLESLESEDQTTEISEPMYEAMDKYYEPLTLISKDNKVIKVC